MNTKRTDHLRPPLSLVQASGPAAGAELRVGAPVHANVPASGPRESTIRRIQIVRGTARHDDGVDTESRAHVVALYLTAPVRRLPSPLLMSNGYGVSAIDVSGAQADR